MSGVKNAKSYFLPTDRESPGTGHLENGIGQGRNEQC